MSYQNAFVTAVNNLGRTENGALTYTTTNSALLDFFSRAAVTDINSATDLFRKAFNENPLLAMKISWFLRDVREGQGKRDVLRATINTLIKTDVELLNKTLPYIPLIGRWKDVFEYASKFSDSTLGVLHMMIEAGVADESHRALLGKWLPRKGDNAKSLTKLLGLSPREYRKLAVGLSDTVEQKMCAKDWESIDFSKLPSKAAKIYQKAFMKNATESYTAYVESLKKEDKTVKVNAATLFPSDIITSIRRGDGNADVLNAQWKALPNYMEGCSMNILPIVDVSGSMDCQAYGNTTAMDVAIALGTYISTRNEGAFKNLWCTFSAKPTIENIKGNTIKEQWVNMKNSAWGYNTNLQAVFNLILGRAQSANVPAEDMPEAILIISDMEFDTASRTSTNFETIKAKYAQVGYRMPKVVFWNANARGNNSPVTKDEENVVLIGGYSPVAMKTILARGFAPVTPWEAMMNTIQDKYMYLDEIVK
jgi:hypothetical protein